MARRKLILHRLTAHFGGQIRQNQRLLSSHFYSFTALEEAPSSSSSSSSPNLDGVYMTDTCVQWAVKDRKGYTQQQLDEVRIEVADYLQTLL
ncbi:uncharacterized protein LOC133707061 isoform X1 [Rosa rugosa]|uniref:uncharacterized protein LOC133707061 isoform X1 n=1 Tax=Rosa rugosa TaxID=74645 RepID=UPI002B40EF17|nr:uncharacterized protein LOC133707061 isoform X1 [Rosa rugosa]